MKSHRKPMATATHAAQLWALAEELRRDELQNRRQPTVLFFRRVSTGSGGRGQAGRKAPR